MASIADLNENYPDGDVYAGSVLDDDARNTKAEILATFTGVAGEVTASQDELNYLESATSLQPQFNTLDSGLTASEGNAYFISGRAASTGELYPGYPSSAWTVYHPSTGEYQIIHNLGVDNTPNICIWHPGGIVAVEANNNSFTVHVSFWGDSSVSGRSARDTPFIFTLAVG